MKDLHSKLKVGAKIRIGEKYAKANGFKSGEIITLIEGTFERYNGLYDEIETAPSIWDEDQKDFDSIYHLFGNEFEYFADCEVLTSTEIKSE